MTLPVFHSDAATRTGVGALIALSGEEGRHAVVVKRIRPGEQVMLTDGAGVAVTGTVQSVTKAALCFSAESRREQPAPSPALTVVQAIPKGERGELAVEMLTEIGVDRIVPWAAARCVAVWRGERAARSHGKWASAARSAAKQARRLHWPEVTPMFSTAAVVELVGSADLAVVLHEAAAGPLVDLPVPRSGSIVVVVGPEGGITEDELTAFGQAHIVRLGDSVLRTSTAGVAAVAALLARTGRWA